MTTTVTTPATAAVPAEEPRVRFRDLIASESLKLWSLRSTPLALGISALVMIGANVNAAIADYDNFPTYPAHLRSDFAPAALFDAFTNVASMILMLAAGSIGAIMIVSEYSTGLVRTTFAAVPARRAVMAAKVAVLAAVMFAFGIAVAATSFWVTQAILSGRHAGVSISHQGALNVVIATSLFAPVCALVGLGLGSLIRHSAVSVVVTVFVLMLLPTFFTEKYRWTADLLHAMPHSAWYHLSAEQFVDQVRYPQNTTSAWIVLATWSIVAAIVAIVTVDRRDV